MKSKFIAGIVGSNDGLITVMALYKKDTKQFFPGRLFLDPQLSFYKKSFLTVQIGNTYFTNNEILPTPPPPYIVKKLNTSGVSQILFSPNHSNDTIETLWADNGGDQNGIDIIQDVYPVDFTESGVMVFKWRVVNHTGSPVNMACQYLNDIQITDPTDPNPASSSNDGPNMLTKYQYDGYWTQIPYPPYTPTLPWFYIAFLHNLPNAPSFNPGLSAMGYMDYGAPLNLLKPIVYNSVDWFTCASWVWGLTTGAAGQTSNEQAKVNNNTAVGSDNAVLLMFQGTTVPANIPGKLYVPVQIGKTAYGTGEYEQCEGQMFSLVFYPHHLVWHKDYPKPPGSYSPDSVHIEKFMVDPGPPQNTNAAANTNVTLTVSKHLTLSADSLCMNNLGQTKTKPGTPQGVFIKPGGVAYFDWWACPNPAYFCKGSVTDTLTFTATCSNCNPAFIDQMGPNIGSNQCQLPIIIDCAETDTIPPQYTDTVINSCDSVVIHVHDRQKNDKGIASITWKPTPGSKTDTNKVKVLGPFPPVKPCYFDTLDHVLYIWKQPGTLDTIAGGSFDFTFTDCIGNISYATIAIPVCPLALHPDSLPPVFTLLKKSGTYDSTFTCGTEFGNNRIDSFKVTDDRQYDSGIDSIGVTTANNMYLDVATFTHCASIVNFKVIVTDSMYDGSICLRAFDCLKKPAPHYTDTCIYYCTIHDTLPPLVTITKDPTTAGKWTVCVYDDRPWDRHIDEIFITGPSGLAKNVHLMNIPGDTLRANTTGKDSVCFNLIADDTTQLSSFCIEATDLAGNRTQKGQYCSNQGISHDTLCPNISFTPPLNTNPASVTVTVDDIHTVNGNPYVWDSGVDSVWFTGNHGMIVPPTIHAAGAKTVPGFIVKVRDSTIVDTVNQFCVTINAVDMAGNVCYAVYCYPYTGDSRCPVTTLAFNPADSSITGIVTDSTIYDRGLFQITTGAQGPNDNLTPVKYTANGAKVQQVTIVRPNNKMSSVGTLTSQDVWGALTSSPDKHICTVNFAIWVQTFKLHDANPNQSSNFAVPVYFVKNDSFAVFQKGITSLSFTVRKNASTLGDLNAIRFDSLSIMNTELGKLGWDTTSKVSGANNEIITITATMKPGGKPLDAPPLVTGGSDSLLLLKFHANADQSSRHLELVVDQIIFNNNVDSTYTASCCSGINSTAIMPAPYGAIDSATIVTTGECAPRLLTDSKKPTSVSLDPNHPNPFSHKTTFNYTVATEGQVVLAIYDELGKEVVRLVDQVQKQGVYTLTFDGSKLAGGNYIARIQSGGVVISRSIGIEK